LLASIFKSVGKRLIELDPKRGAGMIAGLKSYLTEYDRSNIVFDNIADYVKFRGLNVGYG
jgi:predicted transcriptional regulator